MTDIALVEDDQGPADAYRKWLTEHDSTFVIHHFSTRKKATDAFNQRHFDLVIMDVRLNGENTAGFGLLHELSRKKGHTAPVIVISGTSPGELYENLSRDLDAWDYLEKPISPESLISVVENALRATSADAPHSSTLSKDLSLNLANARYPTWRGKRLILPITGQRMLQLLASQPGVAVTKAELAKLMPSSKSGNALAVHIAGIRAAFIAVDPAFDKIVSAPMLGYLWKA